MTDEKKPLVTYRMKADLNTPQGRTTAYSDLGVLLAHLESFNVTPKSIQFFTDGSIMVNLVGVVPHEQLEHVGIEPTSEVKREI